VSERRGLRTVVVYGNCQAGALWDVVVRPLETAGYTVRFARSYADPRDARPAPSAPELAACVLLLEQIDVEGFPKMEALPAGCPVVRFPSLDTNLLWPFDAINPYDEAVPGRESVRYPYGDRILLRCIERDWDAERTIAYYLDEYADYRVDLPRLAEIERNRLRARDAKADVKMFDAIHDVVAEPLFWSRNHPRASLLATLARRVAAVSARFVPELADREPAADAFDAHVDRVAWTAVPVHPGVAADLGCAWYDPHERYRQFDGTQPTHDEYVRAFVESAIATRELQQRRGLGATLDPFGWKVPLTGPVRQVGTAPGIYPDAFAAPLLRFEVEAAAAVERLTVRAYYPPQHVRAGTVACATGGESAEATVAPGTAFQLTVPMPLRPGERARLVLTCSERLNMFERAESEDSRDLGVLILEILAA